MTTAIPNWDALEMTHDDKIGILIELCNAINEHAPIAHAQGLRTAVEYPAYIGISFDGDQNFEIGLGFADDSRGTVFNWNCYQDNALEGVINLVDPTYDSVAKLFWGQLFAQLLGRNAVYGVTNV